MARILVGRSEVTAMVAMVDDTHRTIPPFPWGALRFIFTSGGDYSSDRTLMPVTMTAHRSSDGIRGAALARANWGPVTTAIQRAFHESRERHHLHASHWKVLIACEVGMVQRPDSRGRLQWCVYSAAHPNSVVPDDEAARLFGITAGSVRIYHTQVRHAIEDEWEDLHAGWSLDGP
jgi:hypothetical protein